MVDRHTDAEIAEGKNEDIDVQVEIGAIDKLDSIVGACFMRDGYDIAIVQIWPNRLLVLGAVIVNKSENLQSYIVVDI